MQDVGGKRETLCRTNKTNQRVNFFRSPREITPSYSRVIIPAPPGRYGLPRSAIVQYPDDPVHALFTF